METAEIIFSVLGTLFVLLAAYGAIKLNRKNFLMGICLFSLLPIIGEFMAYLDTNNWGMLATMMAFIGVALVTIPNKASYGSDNTAATSIARKIGMAIIVVNLIQAYIILALRTDVAAQYAYMHIGIALVVIYVVIKSNSDKGYQWS